LPANKQQALCQREISYKTRYSGQNKALLGELLDKAIAK